jgi:23S rRNA (uracil1939-C5)-methyltransferase
MARVDVLKKKEIIDLKIEDLAYGGRGVARYEGKVFFVEDALPGDSVRISVTKIKPDYCEGRVIDLLEPSFHRLDPPCRHFDICGGCKWQNYEYDMQLRYKSEQLLNHLKRIARIETPPVEPIIGARKIYYYRNKMEFSFHRDHDGELLLGLHRAAHFDKVFNIEKCHLQSELSNEIVNYIRQEANRLDLPAYHIKEHKGLLRFLVIKESKFTDEMLVNLVTSDQYSGYEDKVIEMGKALSARFKKIKSLLWTVNSRKTNIARWDSFPPGTKNGLLHGRDHMYEKLGRYRFRISADSFFQTNSYQAQVLFDTIVEYADFNKLDQVGDLYCGTGTIAIYISSFVKNVTGVETISRAVDDARFNAEENGVHNVQFIAADVEDAITEIGKFNKVIIDPPRSGLHPKALKGILKLKPESIIYVSCNPSTLARDIALLTEGGYSLEKAIAVDMFPHTYHIESIARLILK